MDFRQALWSQRRGINGLRLGLNKTIKSLLGLTQALRGSERQIRALRGFEGRETAPQEPEATQEGMELSCSEKTKCSDSPYIGLSHFNP